MIDAPPFPPSQLPNRDARTHALNVFAQWLASLVYRRTMAVGAPPEAFQIPPERIFIEQPDSVEGLVFPAIGIIPGRGQYLVRGIGGADPLQDTLTSDGRALVIPYDYQEQFTVEGIGSKISERRSIAAAIEVAMGMYEGTTDLRLVMEDYFGIVATFTLMERENIDDVDVQRGRRKVHLSVQMIVPVVAEARFFDLQTGIDVNVSASGSLGIQTSGLVTSSGLSGAAALQAFGVDEITARQIARVTFGLTPLQADALPVDMLVETLRSLAAQNARFTTAQGPGLPDSVPTPAELRARLQQIGTP
jgi:hypothetical protein